MSADVKKTSRNRDNTDIKKQEISKSASVVEQPRWTGKRKGERRYHSS